MSNSSGRCSVPTQSKINTTYAEKKKKDVFHYFRFLFNRLVSNRGRSHKKPKVHLSKA